MRIFKLKKSKPSGPGKLLIIEGLNTELIKEQVSFLDGILSVSGLRVQPLKILEPGQLFSVQMAAAFKESPYAEAVGGLSVLLAQSSPIKIAQSGGITITGGNYCIGLGAKIARSMIDPRERASFYRWLAQLGYVHLNLPRPDLNVVLLDASSANTVGAEEYTFLELASLLPNTQIVFCQDENKVNLPPQAIHNRIWDLTRRLVINTRVKNE